MAHGWLPRAIHLKETWDDLHPDLPLDPSLPTRYEEYTLGYHAAQKMPPTLVLDLGSGWDPRWHIYPYLLAKAGHKVIALDFDERHLDMPAHDSVQRVMGNMVDLSRYEDDSFALVTSISVIEHIKEDHRTEVLDELFRVARHGVLITTDDIDPPVLAGWATDHGWDPGPRTHDPEVHLCPRVSFLMTSPKQ